jgi:hypothetical protein
MMGKLGKGDLNSIEILAFGVFTTHLLLLSGTTKQTVHEHPRGLN